ncbi:methyltransferase domain-containing protein [Piscirickettsia salmonis]|uniref:methyltransferase domain-containing protein n=1 Tax=Piscirickettsia salmonis TaxID=1238 RepID=UPI0007C897D3|nr:hypothetical protein A0O36_00902 [Piscirickettsiaceae bacterium NZ-RLO1]
MKYRQWRYRMMAWYQSALGEEINLSCEKRLTSWLNRCGGQVAMSLGVPLSLKFRELLAEKFFYCECLSDYPFSDESTTQLMISSYQQLALLESSVDVVVLAHALECVDDAEHLLSEATRILQPGGHLIVYGFNPMSLWGGIRCILRLFDVSPWDSSWVSISRIEDIMLSLGYEVREIQTFLYRLPIANKAFLQYFSFLERIPDYHVGALYFMVFRKLSISPLKEKAAKKQRARSKINVVLQNFSNSE